MLRDLWRGEESWRAGELERETEVSGRAHKTRQAKAPPALPSLRAARLPLPATPTTLSVFRRTHHTFTVHKGLHMTVDGWRPRISIYQSFLSLLFSCTKRLLLLRSSLHPNNAVDRALLNKQYLAHRQRQSPTSYSSRHP